MKFATKVIHAGIKPDPSTGAIMTPIFQTSTYVQSAPGEHQGFEYARTHNPTRRVLQENIASLENGTYGIAFGSGMAAMDALMRLLEPGDEIISTNDLYGGSYRLVKTLYERYGIKSKFIDLTNTANLEEHISPATKLVWLETPTNPLLNIIDIKKVVGIAATVGAKVCVDNTFASPYLQTPIDLGVDIIHHSATKYIAGHSDVVMGLVVVKDQALAERLYYVQNAVGAVPGPQDCFLTLRGIKTLHLRMERACQNAKRIAHFLRDHSAVAKVLYPGFESHPNHEIAAKQMRDFGAMVSFDLVDNSMDSAHRVLSNTGYFSLAESLGGVESLIGHPASMTHASIPREERLKTGLTDSLIRLSIGIEDADDLIEDLDHALAVPS